MVETVKEEEKIVLNRPQIIAERNAQKVSAFSLKSIQKKQAIKKVLVSQQPDQDALPTEDFSEEDFIKVWHKYTKKLENCSRTCVLHFKIMILTFLLKWMKPKLNDMHTLLWRNFKS